MIQKYGNEVDLLKIKKCISPLTKYVPSDIFYGLWSLTRSPNKFTASEIF